ncbi:hypothetical protein [Acidisoma silvae]|uniref:Uncharacterized protein n=1 Tax=Acidisoma silvae TaxID=2802396 RepID=A0A963YWH1_9PROT|nr:hypothetical protein [Acidisoma silvae]MCB8878155.1 hypothetical protein [Acidisoma silvae]
MSTGYIFGTGNNLFHLGIVGALYDLPQYKHDVFIQSLRHYSAGPWLLFSGKDKTLSVSDLFFLLLFLSRFLSILGFLLCASLIGLVSTPERLVFASIIATCSVMRGLSLAGGGGLFIAEFTHSEIANGLTLIMLYFLGRRNLLLAVLFNALVFFTNAFVAIWNLAPLLMIGGYWIWAGQISHKKALRDIAIAIVPALAIAAPVLINVATNPDYGRPMPVDYETFLDQYWPLHFLFWKNSIGAITGLGIVIALGAGSLRALHLRNPFIALASLGYILVYLVGIIVPLLTHNPTILNLHLLRSSTFLHIMTSLIAAALTTRWFFHNDVIERRFCAPLLLLAFCSVRAFIPLAILPILLSLSTSMRRTLLRIVERRPSSLAVVSLSVGAIMLGAWAVYGKQEATTIRESRQQLQNWIAIAQWAGDHTAPDSVFLLPTKDIRPGAAPPKSFAGDTAVFEFVSHRQVWVDFIRGAAAMWTPSYYREWNSRIWPVLALQGPEERMAYARKHHISYLVETCTQPAAMFSFSGLCVYATGVEVSAPNTY